MSKLKLNPESESLRDILGNGKKYQVPKFQRDYTWEQEQLEILWEDIEETIQEQNNYHYMGYLVLEELEKDNEYKVIDGQQRLTSFSLLVLSAIKQLKKNDNEDENGKKRADILFKYFIGVEEFDGITINRKLTLNKNNDYYYGEAVNGNPLPQRRQKKTVHLMGKAIRYFDNQLKNKSNDEISNLIEKVSNQFIFTSIYIGSELSAYKVFETLNARGVHLTSSDLLKNYLFSLIDNQNNIPMKVLDELENKWEKIGAGIGDKYYTKYISAEWNSRNKLIREQKLFSAIQKQIKDNVSAKEYLDRLATNSQIYEAISNPHSDFFRDEPDYPSIRRSLIFLRLYSITQPFSLLLIAYQKQKNNFVKILKWIEIFSLRYNVICRKHTGEQENLYNKICLKIVDGSSLTEIKNKLLTLYPTDNEFKNAFSDKTMLTHQSNKKARYLLARLEESLSDSSIDESRLTVEHILPQAPESNWIEHFGDNYNLFTQRIGNLTLTSQGINKELNQKSFLEKKKILLEKVKYKIHDNLKSYEEWSSQEIESRQAILADVAVNFWKIED